MSIIEIHEIIEVYNPGTVPYHSTDQQYRPLIGFFHEIIPWVDPQFPIPDVASKIKLKLVEKEIDPWVSIREIHRWGEKQGIQVTLYREDGGRGGGIRLKDEVIAQIFGLQEDHLHLTVQAIRNGSSPRYLELIGTLPPRAAKQIISHFYVSFDDYSRP